MGFFKRVLGVEEIERNVKELEKKIDDKEKAIKTLQEALEVRDKQLSELQENLSRVVNRFEEIESRFERVNNQMMEYWEKVNSVLGSITELRQELVLLKGERVGDIERIAGLEMQLKELQDRIDGMQLEVKTQLDMLNEEVRILRHDLQDVAKRAQSRRFVDDPVKAAMATILKVLEPVKKMRKTDLFRATNVNWKVFQKALAKLDEEGLIKIEMATKREIWISITQKGEEILLSEFLEASSQAMATVVNSKSF